MLIPPDTLHRDPDRRGYAIGAFNIDHLEGVQAILTAPESARKAGPGLMHYRKETIKSRPIPALVHLDHCNSEAIIREAITHGLPSIMADGNHSFFRHIIHLMELMAWLSRRGKPVQAVMPFT